MKKDTLLFLIATIIFGTNGLISRYINVSSFFLVASRGLIASIFIYLVLFLQGKKINWKAIKNNGKKLLVSGILLGFMWIFIYTGYKYSVSITSLVNNTAPIFVILISGILFKEKLTKKQIICVVLVFLGVLLVSGIFEEEVSDIHGLVYGFLAMICFCFNVILNKEIKDVEPLDRTLVQIFLSFVLTTIVAIFTKQIPTNIDTTSASLIILIGVLNTGVAYILYYSSVTTLPAYELAIIGYLEPVISIVLGVVILKEKITPLGIIGSIIIIVSTCVGELSQNKKK